MKEARVFKKVKSNPPKDTKEKNPNQYYCMYQIPAVSACLLSFCVGLLLCS